MSKFNILNNIKNYSRELKDFGLNQLSADLDYFVAWYNSTEIPSELKLNSADHLQPHPAGKDTIGPAAILSMSLVDHIENSDNSTKVVALLSLVHDEISALADLNPTDIEIIAINSFINYVSNVVSEYSLSEDINIELIVNAKCASNVPQLFVFNSPSIIGWTVIRSQADLNLVNSMVGEANGTSYHTFERSFGQIMYNPFFEYTITAVYEDDGITEIDVPDNYFKVYPQSEPDMSGHYTWPRCVVKSSGDTEYHVMAYKIKIQPKRTFQEYYFTSQGANEAADNSFVHGTTYNLYDSVGNLVEFNSSKLYVSVQFKSLSGAVVPGGATISLDSENKLVFNPAIAITANKLLMYIENT